MTTYPLPTLTVTVTSTGITAPAYADILLSLQASYQNIYGSDVSLDPSTQDGGWLAIQATAINDSNQAAIAVYNTFSPSTAIGAGLSSVVKTNGIQRLIPSNSTAPVVIVGQAGATINNGIVGDALGLGTTWALPATVIIPPGGDITVTATSQTAGAVTAAVNTLTVIQTPTYGWQSVTNSEAAAAGSPVESDSDLRQRQTVSTALPSQTPLAGIIGGIANITGVTAISFDENDTSITDGNAVTGHCLAMVVEGGNLQSIVNVIGLKKTIGCNTQGNTSGTYIDPSYGFPYTIYFSIPTQETILVTVSITPLTGYSSSVGVEIQNTVSAYIAGLGIGTDILLTRIFAPALLQGPYAANIANPADSLTYEINSIQIAISPNAVGSSDLPIAFNQLPICAPSNVTITVL